METVTESSLNDISMLYFTMVLSELKLSWLPSKLFQIKTFLSTKVSSFKIEYQQVIFHNISLYYTNNVIVSEETFTDSIKLFSLALRQGLLMYDGKCWDIWIAWFQKLAECLTSPYVIKTVLESSLQKYISARSDTSHSEETELFILVLLQCELGCDMKLLFSGVTDVMRKLTSNPYLDAEKINRVFRLLTGMLNIVESSFSNISTKDSTVTCLLNLFLSYFHYALEHFLYTYKNFSRCLYNEEISEQGFLLLTQFTKLSSSQPSLKPILQKFFTSITDLTTSKMNVFANLLENKQYDYSNITYDIVTVKIVLRSLTYGMAANREELLDSLVSIITHLDRQTVNSICKNMQTVLTCEIFIVSCWSCFRVLLDDQNHDTNETVLKHKDLLLETYFSDLELISHDKMLSMVSVGHSFVSGKDTEEQVFRLIDFMWRIIIEETQADHSFWKLFEYCIQVMFHKDLLLCSDEKILQKLQYYCGLILQLGEKKTGVVNILIGHFIGVWQDSNENAVARSLSYFVDLLVQIAVFGPLQKKHVRPYNDVIGYLHACDKYDRLDELRSVHSQDQNVRIVLVNFILNLQESVYNSFFEEFVTSLVKFEKSISNIKRCYYPNSEVHRQKLRSCQMVLILLDKLDSGYDYDWLITELYASLFYDNQPSIRYFIEWCILLIYCKNSRFIESLWRQLEAASEKKLSTVTSVISICMHLTKILDNEAFVPFARCAIPKVFPWAQAQHMSSRINSQAALQVMWDSINERNLTDLKKEFSLLEYCFTLKEHNTSVVKHRSEMLQTFFYAQFHPLNHYSLESIFCGVLSQTEVLADEWIQVHQFVYADSETNIHWLKLYDKHGKSVKSIEPAGTYLLIFNHI